MKSQRILQKMKDKMQQETVKNLEVQNIAFLLCVFQMTGVFSSLWH